MGMDQVNEIKKIKESAFVPSMTPYEREKVIDTLATTYGERAILAIIDIADSTVYARTKKHAIDTIKRIKERNL
jgi:hypothetical protein